jgi:hypothetical protein
MQSRDVLTQDAQGCCFIENSLQVGTHSQIVIRSLVLQIYKPVTKSLVVICRVLQITVCILWQGSRVFFTLASPQMCE